MKKVKQSALKRAIDRREALPGTDLTREIGTLSKSTIRRYLNEGWIKDIGGYVLTQHGYMNAK